MFLFRIMMANWPENKKGFSENFEDRNVTEMPLYNFAEDSGLFGRPEQKAPICMF